MLDAEDHRKLGKRLGLFHFQDEAPGMVFWHPRGFSLLRELEELVRRRMRADGYRELRSPQLLRQPIWEASGHWQSFRDGMFVLPGEGALKPVSCPGHAQVFRELSPSYRELPVRLGELGLVHRAEQSGCLLGLLRLRQFCQDDGHVFCRDDQVEEELSRFLRSWLDLMRAFGIEEPRIVLSSRPELRAGDDAVWDRAEALLASAARAEDIALGEQPGQGAFYGPKLELLLEDRQGREWQCGTLQLDFFSGERLGCAYVDAGGAKKPPVMLHRALLGSLERFLGLLLERHGGALPGWLCPEQARVLPVSAEHAGYAGRVHAELERAGLRAGLDERDERLSRRVFDAHAGGVPMVCVVGAREAAAENVALRERNGSGAVLSLAELPAALVSRFSPPA